MLPEAFLERMKAQLGAEYGQFLTSLERPRAVALRFNPLKGERPDLPFVGQPVPWEPEGVYYDPEARPGLHVYHEAGVIKKHGEVVEINNPNDATALHIGMVHQHF